MRCTGKRSETLSWQRDCHLGHYWELLAPLAKQVPHANKWVARLHRSASLSFDNSVKWYLALERIVQIQTVHTDQLFPAMTKRA